MKINLNRTVKGKDHDGYKTITTNDLMWYLSKTQGDVVECMTTEGPSDDFCWHITLTNFYTSEEYVLKNVVYGRIEHYEDEEYCDSFYVNGRTRADRLIEQIKVKGVVDTDHWNKVK